MSNTVIPDRIAGVVRKSLSANYTNATVTQTATNLSFAIAANEVWVVQIQISGQCSSTGGSKFQINAPTGATIEGWFEGTTSTITTLTYQRITTINALTGTAAWTVATTPAPAYIWVRIKNSTNSGTVSFGAASVTATQTTTIFAGSNMYAYKVLEV
jgi:hypothetical protein